MNEKDTNNKINLFLDSFIELINSQLAHYFYKLHYIKKQNINIKINLHVNIFSTGKSYKKNNSNKPTDNFHFNCNF